MEGCQRQHFRTLRNTYVVCLSFTWWYNMNAEECLPTSRSIPSHQPYVTSSPGRGSRHRRPQALFDLASPSVCLLHHLELYLELKS